jgi:hypothetical protein
MADNTYADLNEEAQLACSSKLAFSSKQEAQTAATVAGFQYGASVRPYLCRLCGLWHLATHYDHS